MIVLELYDEFHEASRLTGDDRLSKVEEYADLARKSNLLEYIKIHLSESDWDGMKSFVADIRTREKEIKRERRLDFLTNQAEWQDYDPTYLIGCAQAREDTKWLVPLLEKCTRAYIGSRFYTTFAISRFTRQLGEVYPIDFEINKVKEKFFDEHDYCSSIDCTNHEQVNVDVEFGLDGPSQITGIEYPGRFYDDDDSTQRPGEAIEEEAAGDGFVGLLFGKEREQYNSILRIFHED